MHTCTMLQTALLTVGSLKVAHSLMRRPNHLRTRAQHDRLRRRWRRDEEARFRSGPCVALSSARLALGQTLAATQA
jgi:hypothetical protein